MAFLDNSGDIILDAVLTDVGRKRMAQGDFAISKFSIGDDEIDYGLYNKDHPSGSAYYDLEILQTPVLEAFTQINANINYGLLSYARQDLLYLPSIELNQKNATLYNAITVSTNGVIYLADDESKNASGTPTSNLLDIDGHGNSTIVGGGTSKFALIETGINTLDGALVGSSTNQSNYILSVGLTDNNFIVSYDTRFITSVQGPEAGSTFSNNTSSGTADLTVTYTNGVPTTTATQIVDYAEATINGLLNSVYYSTDGSGNDTSLTYSAINGPRASFTTLSFTINPSIPQNDYLTYGRVAQSQGPSSTTYDYIDTVVYVQGASTQVTLQLPIRIIKVSS